jgi:hypothetical protein
MRLPFLAALLVLACTGAEPAPPGRPSSPDAGPATAQPSVQSVASEMGDTVGASARSLGLGFCGDTGESLALRCAHVPSARHGDTLTLGVLHRAPAIRRNEGDRISFRYFGRLSGPDSAGFHVLSVHGYENGWVELIAERSGDSLTLVDYPRVSPDGAHFVVTAASYETCEGVAQIDAWSFGVPLPTREFTVQTFDCGRDLGWWATDVTWRSPDTVSFVRHSLPADLTPGSLVRRATTWALDSASAAALPRVPVDSL